MCHRAMKWLNSMIGPSRPAIWLTLIALLGLAAAHQAGAAVVLNWQFDNSLMDASGSGIDGVFRYYDTGTAAWTDGAATYTSGVFGSAIDMNDMQLVKNLNEITSGLPTAGTDAWTVNVWTSRTGASSDKHVCLGGFGSDPSSSSSYAGTKRFLRIRSNTSSTPNALSLWGNSSGWDYDTTTPYPGDEDWHMFTASFAGGAGGTLTMYLDGDFVGSVTRTFNNTPGAGTLTVQAGSQTGAVPTTEYDGLLDDFSIWNQGLTAGQVKALANVPGSALPDYDAAKMSTLVNVFNDAGTSSGTVGSLTWYYATGLTGHNNGDIWQDGGNYFMQFADGVGVSTGSGIGIYTWNGEGSSNLWTNSANWQGDETPISGSQLVFAGTTQLANVNDLPSGTLIMKLTFDNTAGSFNLGGAALDFSGTMKNQSANPQTVNLPLNLLGNAEFNAEAGDITVSQPIGESGGARNVLKTGAGTLILEAANTYTGTTTVDAGTIRIDNNQALQNSAVAVNVADGVTFGNGVTAPAFNALSGSGNVALQTAAPSPQAVNLTVGGGTYDGILSGPANAGIVKVGSGRLKLTNPSNSLDADVNIVVNAGELRTEQMSMLPGGNLNLAGGIWDFKESANRTLGAGAGQVQLTGGRSGFSALDDGTHSTLTVNLGASDLVWGDPEDPAPVNPGFTPETLVLNGRTARAVLKLENNLDLNTNTASNANSPRTIEVSAPYTGSAINFTRAAEISGKITDSSAGGSGGLIKTGVPDSISDVNPLILSGSAANDYAGTTYIFGGGSANDSLHYMSALILRKQNNVTAVPGDIQIGTDQADSRGALILDGTSTVAYDGSGNITSITPYVDYSVGNEQIADSAAVTFKNRGRADGDYVDNFGFFILWGHTETIGGLNDETTRGIVENWETADGYAEGTLIINSTTDSSYNGRIRNGKTGYTALNLVKDGPATFSLVAGGARSDRGPSYTGATTVNNGTLRVVNAINFAGSLVTVNSPGKLELSASESVEWTFPSPLSGAGTVTKTGPGTTALSDPGYGFTGPVVVQEGKLNLLGSLASASGVQVNSGAALGGTAYDTAPITVLSGGTLAPGETLNPTGILYPKQVVFTGKTTLVSTLSGYSYSAVQVIDSSGMGTYGQVTFNGAAPTLIVDLNVADPLYLPTSAAVLTYQGARTGTPTLLPTVDSIGTSAVALALDVYDGLYSKNVTATFTPITNEWTNASGNGLFGTSGNWYNNQVPGIDNGGFEQALFGGTASGTVKLNVNNAKISSLIFNNSSSYTVNPNTPANPETLILTTTKSGGSRVAVDSQITVLAGSHTVNVPIATETATDPRINVAADSQLTLNGRVSGGGNISYYGPGALVLGNAANTYTGATVMQTAGTLVVAGTGSLGVPADAGPESLVLNGTFRYTGTGTDTAARGATLAGDMTFDIVEPTAVVAFSGELAVPSLPNNVTKTGAGSLALGSAAAVGAADWDTLNVQQGNLTLNGAAGSAYAAEHLYVGNGDQGGTSGGLSLNNVSLEVGEEKLQIGVGGAGTLTLGGNAALDYPGTDLVRLGGTAGGIDGAGTLNLNGGTVSLPGLVTETDSQAGVAATVNFNGGALQATADNADFISNANGGTLTVKVQSGGAAIDTNGHDLTITKALAGDGSSPGGGLIKLGAGDLTLTAVPTYTGATDIQEGLLQLDAPSAPIALGVIASSTGEGDLTVSEGVSLTASSITVRALTIGGGAKAAAAPVPEPSTLVLLALAGLGTLLTARRRK